MDVEDNIFVGDGLDVELTDPALEMYRPWLQDVTQRGTQYDLGGQGWSAEQMLAAQAANHQRRTYGRIPRQAANAFLTAVRPALQVMVGALATNDDKVLVQALRCLLIVPQFALIKSNQTASAMELAHQILCFCEGPDRDPRPPQPQKQATENKNEEEHPESKVPQESKENNVQESEEPIVISDLTPEQQRALKRAAWMASEGRFSKASQAIQQAADGRSGVLDPDQDVTTKLRELHPESSKEPPACPDSAPSGVPMVNFKLRKAGDRIANGSAPDIYGWTGELVRLLLRDQQCGTYVSKLVEAIRDGRICNAARHWLLLSWLIAVDKGNDKIRPIAGGTIFVKLAATYLMETTNQTKNVFTESGVQCGVFMPDGASVAKHSVQLALETHPHNVVIKVDFKNAFNSISRFAILHYLFQQPLLMPFFRLADWIYGQPSTLLLRNSRGAPIASIPSEQGVRQGCALGSLLFANATLRMLKDIRERCPLVEVLAYLDDVFLVGKTNDCLAALEQLTKDAGDMRLEVQPDKSEVLVPPQLDTTTLERLTTKGLCLVYGAMPLLGSVVGTDPKAVRDWATREVESWKKALPLLARKELSVQLSLLLARWSITSKPNFLARTLLPEVTKDLLEGFDQAVLATVEQRTQLHFDDFSRTMLQLPVRHGGVGLSPSAETVPHAYVAGMATAISGFLFHSSIMQQGHFNEVKETASMRKLEEIIQHHYPADSPIKLQDKRHMADLDSFAKHYCHSKHSTKLQSRLVTAFRDDKFAQIQANKDLSPHHRALLSSRANKQSTAAWRAFPLTAEYELTDDDATFMLEYATAASNPGYPERCSCNKSHFNLEHAVHCGPTKLQRHNMMQHRLVSFAREQALAVKQNPRLTVEDAKKILEPDVIFYFLPKPLETDVTVVNPCAPSWLQQTLIKAGTALHSQCQKKCKKYLDSALLRAHDFAPLGFETHGRFSQHVLDLLAKLASNTPDNVGYAIADMTLDLSLTLVRGNALCARRTLRHALRARDLLRSPRS